MSDDRLIFDTEHIRSAAGEVDRFTAEFGESAQKVRDEASRSVATFTGEAGDAFRGHCDEWLALADELREVLGELSTWMGSVADGYDTALRTNRSMFGDGA